MRYHDETKAAFVQRVRSEKGFGNGTRCNARFSHRAPRKSAGEISAEKKKLRDEIFARTHARFDDSARQATLKTMGQGQ